MSVSPARVNDLAGQIRSGAIVIREDLNTLESKINPVRESWSGAAQAAYDDAQRKWNKELAEMQQLLENIASKTEQISAGYTDTDSQAAKRFAI
jgi:WXG100 family type VII secretion target